MPKGSQLAPINFATDADFQTWVNSLHAVIAASGMIQTSDSGQIAIPYTGARPGAVSTAMGYEIWRMNDVQQANYPVFLKLEYGSSSSHLGTGGYWVTIGTGSNGSGTITGVTMGRTQICRNGTAPAGNYENVASYGEGYFCLVTALGATTYGEPLIIQRHLNASGVPTDNAVFVFLTTVLNVSWATLMKQPGGLLIARSGNDVSTGPPVLFNPENKNTFEVVTLNGEVPLYPFEPFLGRRQSPLLGACMVHGDDVGVGVVFTATMYGTVKTWRRVLDPTNWARGMSQATLGKSALAIRWET